MAEPAGDNRIRWLRLLPVVLVGAGLAAFLNGLGGQFVFDDLPRIVKNPAIRSWSGALLNSTRPLVDLSFHLNYRLSGYVAPDFRVVNLAVHLLAALLLYGCVRRTRLRSGAEIGRAAGFAMAVAAIWAVHPLQTECVTYIVQRAEVLAGTALLGTLYCAIRALSAQRPDRWETAAIVICALGMACKPPMAVAPLVVWVYDGIYAGSSWRETWRRRWPFYAGLLATVCITLALVMVPNESTESAGGGSGITVRDYALSQPGVILHYLRLAAWPHPLCLDYAWPPASGWREIVPGLTVVACLAVASVVLLRRRHLAGLLSGLFLLLLAPTSSIVPVADLAVEHRMYLALAPVVAAVCGLVEWGVDRLPLPRRRVARGVAVIMLAALVMCLIGVTRARNRDYSSEQAMWARVIELRPSNFRARTIYVEAVLKSGDYAAAERAAGALVQAIRRDARIGEGVRAAVAGYYLHYALDQHGRALLSLRRPAEALLQFEEAMRAHPGTARYHVNAALALDALGRRGEAQDVLVGACRLDPRQAAAWALRGHYAFDTRDYRQAITCWERALQLDATLLLVRRDLAWVLAAAPEPGLRDGTRATALALQVVDATGGESANGWDVLAAAYAESGQWDAALSAVAKAQARAQDSADKASMGVREAAYRRGEPYRLP